MKIIVTIFFFYLPCLLFGQEELKDIDTTLDYKERFYDNGVLKVQNSMFYFDSTFSYSINQAISNPDIDTSQLEYKKHGLWIEYFDKKWNDCDSSEYHYFRLGEYDVGYYTGKIYDFNKKKEIVRTFLRYPKVNDTTFQGVREINYKKCKITSIQYSRFNEDRTPLFYWHNLYFNKHGVLTSYSFSDEARNQTRFITYSKGRQIIKDYKRDEIEWYDKKWKGTKLKETVYLKGKKVIRVYRNGELVKEKTK